MMKNRHRRIFAVAVAACTVAFAGLSAVPASAHAPVGNEMFNPDEFNGDGSEGVVGVAEGAADPNDPGIPHGPGDNAALGDGETKEAEVASDTGHQVGTTYPLRSVSFTDGTFYEWWHCGDTVGDEWTSVQCNLIASDTTPNVTTPPFLTATVNAWSADWDIPAALEGVSRHIQGVSCASDAAAATAPNAHCFSDPTGASDTLGTGGVQDMHFDDSSSSADHGELTTAGRIWAFDFGACGPQVGVLTGPADPCTDIVGDDVHGALVPAGVAFTVIGFTSDADGTGNTSQDVDQVLFCADTGSGPSTSTVDNANDEDPLVAGAGCTAAALDDVPDDAGDAFCASLGAPFALADCWSAPLTLPAGPNQYGLSMIEIDGAHAPFGGSGSGDCEGEATAAAVATEGDDCQLDKVIITSQTPVEEQVHIHEEDPASGNAQSGEPPDPVIGGTHDVGAAGGDQGSTFCQSSNRRKDDNIQTNAFAEIFGCAFSQFADTDGDGSKDLGERMTPPATFELTGSADFVALANCDGTSIHDHDGDGFFEHCHFTGADYGADGKAEAEFTDAAEEQVTVTFCADSEQGAPASAEHGCADETLKDSMVKTVGAAFAHAHLRFSEDVTLTDDSTCETGDVSKSKPISSNVSLAGCAHDANHLGAEGVPVIWRILDGPGTFVSVEQLTDSEGFSEGMISSGNANAGDVTTVEFCLDGNNNGICDSADAAPVTCPACRATVQITWSGTQERCVRGTQGNDRIRGTEDGDCIRGRRGNDVLRGLGGADDLNGQGDDDKLNGGPGPDDLTGGRGFDICRGGAGRDSFASCEVIKDRQA